MAAIAPTDLRRRVWPWWRVTIVALSALGLAISSYLSWHHLMGGVVLGCDGSSACEQVLSSRWSTIGGRLPVSALAAGAYLTIVLATLWIGPGKAAADRRLAWGAMLALAAAAAASAVWFVILQTWSVGSYCRYCMTLHATSVVVASLIFWCVRGERDDATDAPRVLITPSRSIMLALFGIAVAGAMAAAQLALKPPAAFVAGQTHEDTAIPSRTVSLDPPLVGPSDARYVVTLLFDYRCPHCRQVHAMLDEAVRKYHGTLAFALAPSPLNNKCNPYVATQVAEFRDSCELARIALTVWVANRAAFGEFDRWMFASDSGEAWHGRDADAAQAKAIELLGQSAYDTAQRDPRVDALLQSSVRLYGDTIGPDQAGGAVPKLVFGRRWLTPGPMAVDELVASLQDHLGLPPP